MLPENKIPLVSIILPVFNVRKHLGQCLASLSALNYPRKEIIFVDDASTDGSGELCSDFCRAHPEASVYRFDANQGVSYARAEGLDRARGEYVLYVDSDDYVHPDILDRMVSAALAHHADLVSSRFYQVLPDRMEPEVTTLSGVFGKEDIQRLAGNRILRDDSIGKCGMSLNIWGKLFLKEKMASCIRAGLGLRFGEDTLTVMTYLLRQADTMVCLDDPLYYYVHHPAQVTARHQSELWPLFIPYYERMDALGGDIFFHQLVPRIWVRVKPTVYDDRKNWGGVFFGNQFVRMNRTFRNAPVLKKYLWDNPDVPSAIRRSKHFFLVKHRLYVLDYMMYVLAWRQFR